jgi:hypothetical protein
MKAGFFVVGEELAWLAGSIAGAGCSFGLVANKMGKLLIYPESC